MSSLRRPNRLANASSPYLLQHAHNPVDWFPWGPEALEKAKNEDKPIIVSIGYSACHWCHVMEKNCFEDDRLASLMNQDFVCIKVDREERPDIDQVYMDAVQVMGVRGGWPLNVFLTPEGNPFYGGTYFPPDHWENLLKQIANAFVHHRSDLELSAEKFRETLNRGEYEKYGLAEGQEIPIKSRLEEMLVSLSQKFDKKEGGMNRAPKFPMPCIYLFLLRLWKSTGKREAIEHVVLTLRKMALGGINDQLGGGFARYSTDGYWLVPHFEKMLYDNGQLLSLYAEAYQATGEPLFRETLEGIVYFLKNELLHAEGGFYSALDADSEGEEGRFYVWSKKEIEEICGEDAGLFMTCFTVSEEGNWEDGKNILHARQTTEETAAVLGISSDALKQKLNTLKKALLSRRNDRVRPGLDDKILASWNAIALNGLTDAYRATADKHFLELAEKTAHFISKNFISNERLWHSWKNGKASVTGFLDDYAFTVQAFINLYEATFDVHWLDIALMLTNTCFHQFYDEKDGFFFFTGKEAEQLIARKKELFDNVIPASNSVMATNLFKLGKLCSHEPYLNEADYMMNSMARLVCAEPEFLAGWGQLYVNRVSAFKEVAIVGPECRNLARELDKIYTPFKVLAGDISGNHQLPVLTNRASINGQTTIYVCENRVCNLPVTDIKAAIELVNS